MYLNQISQVNLAIRNSLGFKKSLCYHCNIWMPLGVITTITMILLFHQRSPENKLDFYFIEERFFFFLKKKVKINGTTLRR